MDKRELIDFVRSTGLGVVASTGPDGSPQAALVGIASTDTAEIVFDAQATSRKVANIERDPRVAVVIGGWGDELTVQLEGDAEVVTGQDLERCQTFYLSQYPDGRQRARRPGIVYIRITPRWVRCSDFRPDTFGSTETTL